MFSCTNSTALAQAQKEAEEAAAQAAATEESRQKAVGMGKPIFARSLKPLTEPKDVEFHTAKRQRMQGDAQADKVLNTRLQHCYLQKTMHALTTMEKKKHTPQKKSGVAFLTAARRPVADCMQQCMHTLLISQDHT